MTSLLLDIKQVGILNIYEYKMHSVNYRILGIELIAVLAQVIA